MTLFSLPFCLFVFFSVFLRLFSQYICLFLFLVRSFSLEISTLPTLTLSFAFGSILYFTVPFFSTPFSHLFHHSFQLVGIRCRYTCHSVYLSTLCGFTLLVSLTLEFERFPFLFFSIILVVYSLFSLDSPFSLPSCFPNSSFLSFLFLPLNLGVTGCSPSFFFFFSFSRFPLDYSWFLFIPQIAPPRVPPV